MGRSPFCNRPVFLSRRPILKAYSTGGGVMQAYLNYVMMMCGLVNFLLLLAVDRFYGIPPQMGRNLLAAAVGGLYSGISLVPKYVYFGSFGGHALSMLLIAMLAFGVHRDAVGKIALFMVLSFAVSGAATTTDSGQLAGTVIGLLCILVLSVITRGRPHCAALMPVELEYRDKKIKIKALRDTGNTLRDPITGSEVLVVSSEVAERLLGLSQEQLSRPVETMETVPGLRLIPYRAVGISQGMLLGKRFSSVKIGSWSGSSVVAFAPNGLSCDGSYQALTGRAFV